MVYTDHENKITWQYIKKEDNPVKSITSQVKDFQSHVDYRRRLLEDDKPGDLDESVRAKMWHKFYHALGVANRECIEALDMYETKPVDENAKLKMKVEVLERRIIDLERNAKYDDMASRKHM